MNIPLNYKHLISQEAIDFANYIVSNKIFDLPETADMLFQLVIVFRSFDNETNFIIDYRELLDDMLKYLIDVNIDLYSYLLNIDDKDDVESFKSKFNIRGIDSLEFRNDALVANGSAYPLPLSPINTIHCLNNLLQFDISIFINWFDDEKINILKKYFNITGITIIKHHLKYNYFDNRFD